MHGLTTMAGLGAAGVGLVGIALLGTVDHGSTHPSAPTRPVGAAMLTSDRSDSPGAGPASSRNWAGYAQYVAARSVGAQWRVPRITSPRPEGYSSTWVGIDGLEGRYLTQVGTGQDVVAGRVSTYAWWEVITPTDEAPEQRLALTIHPGDLIAARVGVAHGMTTVTLSDLSTKRSVTRHASYRGPGASAEWIQEDVDADNRISPAPAWSPVRFSRLRLNDAPARLRPSQALDIVDATGVRETATSRPGDGGDQFDVRRLAAGHWTPLH